MGKGHNRDQMPRRQACTCTIHLVLNASTNCKLHVYFQVTIIKITNIQQHLTQSIINTSTASNTIIKLSTGYMVIEMEAGNIQLTFHSVP